MTDSNPPKVDKQGRYPWEFWLVIGMLVSLLILILVILQSGIPKPDVSVLPEANRNMTFQNLLDYNNTVLASRQDTLAIILTAFGAWIGAGAAYFFGRENLRVAAEGLLAMREESPRARLRRTSIKQLPPASVDWTVDETTALSDVQRELEAKPGRWFVPVVNRDKGTLTTVINEEGVWRYLLSPEGQTSQAAGGTTPPPKTVKDLLAYLDKSDLKRFKDIHVTVTMDTTVGTANDLMDNKSAFLAIIEDNGKPTHFFTTSEIRKLLLQGG